MCLCYVRTCTSFNLQRKKKKQRKSTSIHSQIRNKNHSKYYTFFADACHANCIMHIIKQCVELYRNFTQFYTHLCSRNCSSCHTVFVFWRMKSSVIRILLYGIRWAKATPVEDVRYVSRLPTVNKLQVHIRHSLLNFSSWWIKWVVLCAWKGKGNRQCIPSSLT